MRYVATTYAGANATADAGHKPKIIEAKSPLDALRVAYGKNFPKFSPQHPGYWFSNVECAGLVDIGAGQGIEIQTEAAYLKWCEENKVEA